MTNPADVFSPLQNPPRFRENNLRKRNEPIELDIKIYPLSKLPELIEKVRGKKLTHKIRYLVDTNYKLWFAEEGTPSKTIPPHHRMSNSSFCFSAGNIRFTADFKSIHWSNHKSGDFQPSFDSIKWLLAILVANQELLKSISLPLPPQLLINELTSSGGDKAAHTFETAELISWINLELGEEQLISLRQQPTEIKEIIEINETSCYPFARTPGIFFASPSFASPSFASSSNEELQIKRPRKSPLVFGGQTFIDSHPPQKNVPCSDEDSPSSYRGASWSFLSGLTPKFNDSAISMKEDHSDLAIPFSFGD